MPVRALLTSLLLALVLTAGINTAAATAKAPKAKIALGAKQKAKKCAKAGKKAKATKKAKAAKCAKAAKKAKSAKKANRPRRTPAPTTAAPSAPAPAPAAPATCANTELLPDAGNLDAIRAALMCLHNQVRAQSGIGALSENGALAAAGAAHSADMVRRGYFDHTTPDGGSFSDRILAARYVGAGEGWSVGENLAWGTGQLSTPAALMRSWMNSAGHRDNILKPAYREIGFGLVLGTPTGAATGVTVSVEFGARVS